MHYKHIEKTKPAAIKSYQQQQRGFIVVLGLAIKVFVKSHEPEIHLKYYNKQ
jgi:hypothetical protein